MSNQKNYFLTQTLSLINDHANLAKRLANGETVSTQTTTDLVTSIMLHGAIYLAVHDDGLNALRLRKQRLQADADVAADEEFLALQDLLLLVDATASFSPQAHLNLVEAKSQVKAPAIILEFPPISKPIAAVAQPSELTSNNCAVCQAPWTPSDSCGWECSNCGSV